MKIKLLLPVFTVLLFSFPLMAQSQSVIASASTYSYTVSNIPYNPFPYDTGNAVLVNIDDTWSSVISIPFFFQYYGNNYNQLVIGSNGLITFDLTSAGGYCPWSLSGTPIPDPTIPKNSIMGPYQDIDPTYMGNIYWQIIGSAPSRAFIVSFYQVPYFGDPNSVSTSSCPNPLFATSQIVLYETTSIIDIYIKDKPVCTGWNSGYGIEGIQDATGTNATPVSGRNNTVWTVNNDGKRFSPGGNCLTTFATIDSVINTSACGLNDGAVYISDSTIAAPLTYTWSNGASTQDITGLAPGNYSITINDTAGCSINLYVIVGSPSNMIISNSITTVSCFGGNNGAININVSGGTVPYTFNWSNGATTQNVSGLNAGTYSVAVADANGCSTSLTAVVTGAPLLTVSSASTPSSCFTCPDGSASSSVNGGTPPYLWQWSNGQNTQNITGITPGSYTVCVTDANGCVVCNSTNILFLDVNELLNYTLCIFPNPSTGILFLDFGSKDFGKTEISIVDIVGEELIIEKRDAIGKQLFDISTLSNGVYFIHLKTNHGTIVKKIIINK